MRPLFIVIASLAVAGCTATDGAGPAPRSAAPAANPVIQSAAEQSAQDAVRALRPEGEVIIDLSDALGNALDGRVDLRDLEGGSPIILEVRGGQREAMVPAGLYRAYVHVYYQGIPVLVEIKDIEADPARERYLPVTVIEGSAPNTSILAFDSDGDLALDRVEIEAGTDPYDATSIPGRPLLPANSPVLSPKAGWYRGELFARSHYGTGTESVRELIRRAERADLDFLAITDLNTLASVYDPDYRSDRLVLIPALEWGNTEWGKALIYGPRTAPDPPSNVMAAQAECLRVQAQGGIFTIAHPCLSSAPWQWGLSYVNAVQVWMRDWRAMPPMALEHLREIYHERDERGRLVHSIAAAAGTDGLSGNGQASQFWDYELVRGLMAAAIGGSGSGSPRVPLGQPLTYVFAREKSLEGILKGLRNGHTYITSGPRGPNLFFRADVGADGRYEIEMPGGVVPLNTDVIFEAGVSNAEGLKLQVLLNGYPILTKRIEGNMFVHRFEQRPDHYGVYRIRVIGPPRNPAEGFGYVEVHAMSSPIYAQDLFREAAYLRPDWDAADSWIRVDPGPEATFQTPDFSVPPTRAVPLGN